MQLNDQSPKPLPKLDQYVSKSTIKNELRRRLRSGDLAQVTAGGYALRGARHH